jgi:hypothetical protein
MTEERERIYIYVYRERARDTRQNNFFTQNFFTHTHLVQKTEEFVQSFQHFFIVFIFQYVSFPTLCASVT